MDNSKKKSKHTIPEPSSSFFKSYAVAFESIAVNLACIGGGVWLNKRITPTSNVILILSIFLAMGITIYYLTKRLKMD